ncbi:4-coumarate--CoA ligase 2-like [Eurytemora carolleeae]|nr:4-coumarate--CoA ligase 2-like [Eurytemora carolleeae]|eukprot:XP_023340927.1 4-coumarate--CoA ligase 2-like [Eurytemora affinis]
MVGRVISLSTLHRLSRFACLQQQKKISSIGLRGLNTNNALHAVDRSQPNGVVLPGEEGFIVKSRWSDVQIPEMNLADYVWEDIEHNAANPALVCGMTGRSYSFAMAHGLSKKFGSALLRMGAKKGDVIGLVLPNIPEFPIVFMGAVGVNVTVTTMNPTYRPEEIARQMENSETKFIVTIGMFVQNIKQSCDIYTGVEKIIVIGDAIAPEGCISFLDLIMGEDGSLYGQDK